MTSRRELGKRRPFKPGPLLQAFLRISDELAEEPDRLLAEQTQAAIDALKSFRPVDWAACKQLATEDERRDNGTRP